MNAKSLFEKVKNSRYRQETQRDDCAKLKKNFTGNLCVIPICSALMYQSERMILTMRNSAAWENHLHLILRQKIIWNLGNPSGLLMRSGLQKFPRSEEHTSELQSQSNLV